VQDSFEQQLFSDKSKDGDHPQEMSSVVFLEWFENQLMPALKNPSLVVLDNASSDNVKTEDTVCPNFCIAAVNQTLTSRTCMQNNQTFVFTRGYFWGIRPIIRKL
jgi:transposase